MLVSLRRPLCQLVRIAHRFFFFFFNDTATTEIYTLSLHDALPISAADLPDHRLGGADSARNAAAGAGPCARRRVRRGRDLRRGTCAERPPRLRHGLDPDYGDARLLPRAGGDWRVPGVDGRQGIRRLGLEDSVLAVADPARVLDLHPAQAARVADLPADEGRGQRLQVPLDRQLPQVSEQQVRAARAAWRDRGAGRG